MTQPKVTVPITLPYWLLFLLLTFLCYEAHELFHHLVGGALCGGFGSMTFTTYVPRSACGPQDLVTLAGPALSFAVAWLGAYWLSRNRHPLFAYSLIFASFAHLRFPLPLMGSGDEWLVVRTNSQQPNPHSLAAGLFLLALPPLIVAYRAIANRRRLAVFSAAWLLPFSILFSVDYLNAWLLGPGAATAHLRAFIGVPVLIWLVDLAAVLLFVAGGHSTFRPQAAPYSYQGD